MRAINTIIPPGRMREFVTPTGGRIQVIGGLDQFAIRQVGAPANTPDTIYRRPATFVIKGLYQDRVIKPFRTNKVVASPILDPAV